MYRPWPVSRRPLVGRGQFILRRRRDESERGYYVHYLLHRDTYMLHTAYILTVHTTYIHTYVDASSEIRTCIVTYNKYIYIEYIHPNRARSSGRPAAQAMHAARGAKRQDKKATYRGRAADRVRTSLPIEAGRRQQEAVRVGGGGTPDQAPAAETPFAGGSTAYVLYCMYEP